MCIAESLRITRSSTATEMIICENISASLVWNGLWVVWVYRLGGGIVAIHYAITLCRSASVVNCSAGRTCSLPYSLTMSLTVHCRSKLSFIIARWLPTGMTDLVAFSPPCTLRPVNANICLLWHLSLYIITNSSQNKHFAFLSAPK